MPLPTDKHSLRFLYVRICGRLRDVGGALGANIANHGSIPRRMELFYEVKSLCELADRMVPDGGEDVFGPHVGIGPRQLGALPLRDTDGEVSSEEEGQADGAEESSDEDQHQADGTEELSDDDQHPVEAHERRI